MLDHRAGFLRHILLCLRRRGAVLSLWGRIHDVKARQTGGCLLALGCLEAMADGQPVYFGGK